MNSSDLSTADILIAGNCKRIKLNLLRFSLFFFFFFFFCKIPIVWQLILSKIHSQAFPRNSRANKLEKGTFCLPSITSRQLQWNEIREKVVVKSGQNSSNNNESSRLIRIASNLLLRGNEELVSSLFSCLFLLESNGSFWPSVEKPVAGFWFTSVSYDIIFFGSSTLTMAMHDFDNEWNDLVTSFVSGTRGLFFSFFSFFEFSWSMPNFQCRRISTQTKS